MKIALATPYGAHLEHPDVSMRMANMQSSLLQHQFVHTTIAMHIVSLARHKLVEMALEHDADVVWFVDSDVLLPPNASILVDHIEAGVPVVSGLYVQRHPPFIPQAYFVAATEVGIHNYMPMIDVPSEPTYVDAVGAGCLLVRTDVFRTLREHHEERRTALREARDRILSGKARLPIRLKGVTDAAVHDALALGPWFEFLAGVGEDFYFCEKLRGIGIRPMLEPNVSCGHIGQQAFDISHFRHAANQGFVMEGN